MKNIFFLILLSLLFNALPVNKMVAQTARGIVEKADNKRLGNTSKSTMALTVIRPSWQREMHLKVWTKGSDYLLILITDLVRDKGTSFLKRDKEFWNWIPRIERIVKLPPSAMAQAWMGSDFSNDDLVKMSSMVQDYEQTLLGKEPVDGRDAYKIEMIPKEEAAVVWGKIITWVDQEEFLFLKTEYYDEDDELINTVFGRNIKTMDGRSVTSRLEILPQGEPGSKTVLDYQELAFDEPIAVGLEDQVDRRSSELSGEQQQRVAVVRALASKPQFVLADEPTANLDSRSAENLLDIMLILNEEEYMTFIFSTHDARIIREARRVVTLEDGRIISDVKAQAATNASAH
ncbi:outer membrane lipoprotein-sorting protein [Flavilitoribacter nigricans]|uniref:ABC transporter domain-containing protein n=1 Tax=Flavilitoribacter nigricans (strain ATCC 23147 / DSM 23189 / NBRC 102662 / NCIMB 1420 / SS-2) TaxID=1122177 RepID=A0A2D0N017_FLAN2|nr:outer membrane lipoprotein-sorting protein [Flavilitoribacter nigricans]PHN01854.1 hypothetical protein CRP01_35040 [Flavilitoribacter nigricans DSM 23189 = NBRC 102662]